MLKKLKQLLAQNGPIRHSWTEASFAFLEAGRNRKFQGRHKGDRCFILGTGPSLKDVDITLLANEHVFACNMFFLHEAAMGIAPEYYCVSDFIHWKDGHVLPSLKKAMLSLPDTCFFFEYSGRTVVQRDSDFNHDNIHYLMIDGRRPDILSGEFCPDPAKPLRWGRTVIADFCIPLAAYMQFSEIIIMGVDLDQNPSGKGPAKSYFYEQKKDDRGVDNSTMHFSARHDLIKEHNRLTCESFRVLAPLLSDMGIRVFNASSRGNLDAFERVPFDKLF